MILGFKGPFFHLKHLPILLLSSLLGPFWRKLLLFFKSSGGSVLHTSTFSETSFWTILVRGVLCLDTLLRFWVYLRMPISLNEIKYTQWRIPIQNLKPSSGQLWDRTLVWKATFLKLAQGGGVSTTFLCACLSSWPWSWCLGLCGEISLITSFLSSHHIRLDRSSPDYFKFNSYRPCWISWSFWTRWVMACMFMTVLWSSRLTFGTSVWAYQVWQDLFFVLAQPPDRSWQEFFGNIRIYSSLPTLWLMS